MQLYTVHISGRQWLTHDTFELRFSRPSGFSFRPGQKVGFADQGADREYTLVNAPHDRELAMCVRRIAQGRFTPLLADAPIGTAFRITAATGFFTYRSTDRPTVMIATGTGIAPFVAFARAGVQGFDLLHGVRSDEDLYYHAELATAAQRYIPCISGNVNAEKAPQTFAGHVHACLAERFAPGAYYFYLCGRADMIRDTMRLIDQQFEGSSVFSETFF